MQPEQGIENSNIPESAIDHLKQNPNLAPAFKEKYGEDPGKYLK